MTVVALALSVVLLSTFVLIERRASHPLLPLHIIWDRARGGAYVVMLLAGTAVFGVFPFVTYYLQQSLGFSPLTTGVAFLPMSGMIVVTAAFVQTRLLDRVGARVLIASRMVLGGRGDAAAHPPDARERLRRWSPAEPAPRRRRDGRHLAPAFGTATVGVEGNEAGVASATANTAQQVGGSIGTALLSTIFASAVTTYASGHVRGPGLANAAAIHGYTTAFWWAAALFGVGVALALAILPSKHAPCFQAAKLRATAMAATR